MPRQTGRGTVTDASGTVIRTLRVDGSVGDSTTGIVRVSAQMDFNVSLGAPPAGLQNGKYAVWGWVGKPTSGTAKKLASAGMVAMNPVLSSCHQTICPDYVSSSIEHESIPKSTAQPAKRRM